MSELLEALGVEGGIVCAVGAGGKKTTLYRLAAEWSGPFALTATVMTTPPPDSLVDARIVASARSLPEAVHAARTQRRLAYAAESDKPGRVAGVAADTIASIHRLTGRTLTLVKADGARMRGIKAPRPGEPVIPDGTDLVVHVTSAAVLGRPLDESIAHRPERLSAVMDLEPGAPIEPRHLARLLCAAEGALQNTGSVRVVALINQVEGDAIREQALQAARMALAVGGPERVVLGTMQSASPILDVLRPGGRDR
ncbi:putative selenium-dependent hydroxylase accessory protein YqeC [Ectothiorhodospiraceae bacterium WFHF3C12]|nr:putative selenium-dependent hydroxylase accessory protein YqeC [Ectothiorhodospiraceae bacterium WFHF3C12]